MTGLGLVTGVVAGCQSNPEPPPLEAATAAPSPSASASGDPSPVAPTLPAEAQGRSEAAAKAFVRHYIALINHAVATGESEPLLAASSSKCKSCNAVADRVDAVYAAGGSIESDGWHIDSIAAVPAQPSTRPMFDVGLTMSPQNVVEATGDEVQSFDGGKLPATFSLVHRDGGWRVLSWERAA